MTRRGPTCLLPLALVMLGTPVEAQDVRISGLSDILLLGLSARSQVREEQQVCVYSEGQHGGYRVMAAGSGSGGDFTLSAGNLPELSYEVQWNDNSGQDAGDPLSPNVPLGGYRSGSQDPDCLRGPAEKSSLIILMTSADLAGAVAGVVYSGTLSLTIAPE